MDYQAKLQNKLSGEVLIKTLGVRNRKVYLSKSQSQDIRQSYVTLQTLEHVLQKQTI